MTETPADRHEANAAVLPRGWRCSLLDERNGAAVVVGDLGRVWRSESAEVL